jgi:catechol 2,3-dioxygenase-like lactoylglutathione lyase family enzyme
VQPACPKLRVANLDLKETTWTPISGFSHLSLVTADLDRLARYYTQMFDAELVQVADMPNGGHIAILRIGSGAAMNLFDVPTSDHATGIAAMFGRGHLDHFGLAVSNQDALYQLRRRLMASGHSLGEITSVGPAIGLGATDPDGMDFEVNLILDPTWRNGHAPRPHPRPPPGTH